MLNLLYFYYYRSHFGSRDCVQVQVHFYSALLQNTRAFIRAMDASSKEFVINALETFEAAKTTFEVAVKNLVDAVAAEASANKVNIAVINALETVKAATIALDVATQNEIAAEVAEAEETAEIARVVDAADAPEVTVNTSNAKIAGFYTNRCRNAYIAAERSLIVANRNLWSAQNADAVAKKKAKEGVINANAAYYNAVESLETAKKAMRAVKNAETMGK